MAMTDDALRVLATEFCRKRGYIDSPAWKTDADTIDAFVAFGAAVQRQQQEDALNVMRDHVLAAKQYGYAWMGMNDILNMIERVKHDTLGEFSSEWFKPIPPAPTEAPTK